LLWRSHLNRRTYDTFICMMIKNELRSWINDLRMIHFIWGFSSWLKLFLDWNLLVIQIDGKGVVFIRWILNFKNYWLLWFMLGNFTIGVDLLRSFLMGNRNNLSTFFKSEYRFGCSVNLSNFLLLFLDLLFDLVGFWNLLLWFKFTKLLFELLIFFLQNVVVLLLLNISIWNCVFFRIA